MSRLPENKMGTQPIGRLLFSMALPMIMAMLVQAFYNVVDSVYVSRISATSDSAVTALSLAFPVQNVQIGLAIGIGVGVNSLMSRSLGRRDQEEANRAAGNGIFLALCATVLMMLFGIFCTRTYYTIQSSVTETVEGGVAYTTICCIFTLGLFIEVLGERLLQASGRTKYTLYTQGTGALLNIILDPLFIFGSEAIGLAPMGIAGAAVATVIGQWVAGALAIFFNLRFNPDVQFGLKYLRPKASTLKEIFTVGIPSVVMNCIGAVMNFSMNQILQGFSETATGVFGIYYKLQSFFFMPVFGINNASISIAAYNYGAKKPERITATLKCACMGALGVMILGLLGFQLFPDQLLGLFEPSDEFLRVGRKALRIISLHFPMAAIGIALGASFQALGNGSYSTITSLSRQLIVLLPAAYLLSLTGEVTNVWWAFPIAEFVSLAVTLLFYSRIYRLRIKPMETEDKTFPRGEGGTAARP